MKRRAEYKKTTLYPKVAQFLQEETDYISRTNCRDVRDGTRTTVSVSLLDDSYSSLCYKSSCTCLRLLVFCLHWWDHRIRHLDLTIKLWMQRPIYWGAEYKHNTQYNLILPISAHKCWREYLLLTNLLIWKEHMHWKAHSLDWSQPLKSHCCLIQGTYERDGSGPDQHFQGGQENLIDSGPINCLHEEA